LLGLAHKRWFDSGLVLPGRSTVGRVRRVSHALFDSLYNFARWLAHDSNDAEDSRTRDLSQGLRSFALFQPGTNFRAWIFRILRNNFLSSCSKLERRMTVAMDSEEDGPELAVDTETPETILMNRFNSQLVQRAIDDLPVHYRETLLLVKWKKCRTRRSRKYCQSRWGP